MLPNPKPDLFASVNIYKREDPGKLVFQVNFTNRKNELTSSFLVSSPEEVADKILLKLRMMEE